jgi:toxic protein SymE
METNSTVQNAAREITICGRSSPRSGYYVNVPEVRLMGKWLEQIGFGIGDRIKVECQNQKLIISLAELQPWWEERKRREQRQEAREKRAERVDYHINKIANENDTNTAVRYVR